MQMEGDLLVEAGPPTAADKGWISPTWGDTAPDINDQTQDKFEQLLIASLRKAGRSSELPAALKSFFSAARNKVSAVAEAAMRPRGWFRVW